MPNDYRYNPFSNAPQYINVSERHIIPSQSPYYIRLNEVPNRGDPSTVAVKAIGNDGTEQSAFTEVAATPAAGQFRPDYGTGADGDPDWNTGLIEFNAADAGKLIEVGYQGEGTLASLTTPRWPSWMTDCGDGSDGHVLCANGQSFDGLVQAKSFIVPYGVTVNIGTAGIPLIIRSQGAVIIAGTINGKGKGADGGAHIIDTSADPDNQSYIPPQQGNSGTGGGVGGASHSASGFNGALGAAGGGNVIRGVYVGNAPLSAGLIALIASEGVGAVGAGGGGSGGDVANGSMGGGGLVIAAPEILISGALDLSGKDGSGGYNNRGGAGAGAGGGGTVLLAARTVTLTGAIDVSGGSGVNGSQDGGAGWYKIFELGAI